MSSIGLSTVDAFLIARLSGEERDLIMGSSKISNYGFLKDIKPPRSSFYTLKRPILDIEVVELCSVHREKAVQNNQLADSTDMIFTRAIGLVKPKYTNFTRILW